MIFRSDNKADQAAESAAQAEADRHVARAILPALIFAACTASYLGLLWLANQADLANCGAQIAGHC